MPRYDASFPEGSRVGETEQNKYSAAIDEQTMSLYYTHLLIPEGANFVPQSQQVVAFLEGLTQLGSTPLEPTFKLGNRPGILTGRNFVTGETISIPKGWVPVHNWVLHSKNTRQVSMVFDTFGLPLAKSGLCATAAGVLIWGEHYSAVPNVQCVKRVQRKWAKA
jgi:hypothetical protein